MKTSIKTKKTSKEGPRDLRKKTKRIAKSRDALKNKNKEKAMTIKRLSSKIDDMDESRNKWRQRSEEDSSKARELTIQLESMAAELAAGRLLVQQLCVEVEALKKKAKI